MKGTIYLDSSAINRLADDPAAPAIIAAITRAGHEVHISCLNVLELAVTPDAGRRTHLLTTARRITQSFYPLELPGQILKLSLQAHLQGKDEAVMSVAKASGVWAALCRPEQITETIRLKAIEDKRKHEFWFETQHQRYRQAISDRERPRAPKPAHYILPPMKEPAFVRSFFAEIVRAAGGDPVTVDAVEILQKVGPWRSYFTALALENYNRAARAEKFGRASNPGGIDVQQAVYLSGHDVFITEDKLQRRFLKNVCRIADIKVSVVDYSFITKIMW